MPMTRVNVHIGNGPYERMHQLADQRGRKAADLIRDAIDRFLDEEEQREVEREQRRQQLRRGRKA